MEKEKEEIERIRKFLEDPYSRRSYLFGESAAECALKLLSALAEKDQEIERLHGEIANLNGTLIMAISRLGGIVEGLPTGRHNFLQRIDELIDKEKKL